MKYSYRCLWVLIFVLTHNLTFAKQYTIVKDGRNAELVGSYFDVLIDEQSNMTVEEAVNSTEFQPSITDVPAFGITTNTIWLQISVTNGTSEPALLNIKNPVLDNVTIYKVQNNVVIDSIVSGESIAIPNRNTIHHDFVYELNLLQGETAKYVIKVSTEETLQVPVIMGTASQVYRDMNRVDVLSGIYFGIILVMFLYNLFVYLTVRDKSYLFYVIYILFVGLTQLGMQGYTYSFLWPTSPWLANQSVIFFPAITGIAAIEFFKNFLNVKRTLKKWIYVLNFLNIFYALNCILSIVGAHRLSQQLLMPNAMLSSFILLGLAIYLLRKNSRSAGFFILAWSVFLIGIVLFILKDLGVLPYNNFTNYILHIGSAIEVIVLSFALGDRINILQKEKDESQKQALHALKENANIISRQNVLLESKVDERTKELKEVNEGLSTAMRELQEKETQLVESEKMASLGQLTAGIAHEINNPINFVTSNVKPLRRDVSMLIDMLGDIETLALKDMSVDDKQKEINRIKEDAEYDYLKEEINYLLKGINEGSERTAEIVKGLRVFSRLDEDDRKLADINEGIDSTLVIVRNTLGTNIDINKNYGQLPLVECYPGKLNQVFLNIISNGLQAIKAKFKENKGGMFEIATIQEDEHILISFKDNGIGMDEETKKKIYEPFFTTKDVGEGTGLGMSIVYNTIVKHNGKITLDSEKDKGTTFTITIPVNLEELDKD